MLLTITNHSRWLVLLVGLAGLLVPPPCGEATERLDRLESAAIRDFEHSLAKVQPLLQRYGYGATVLAVMVEGMGIPAPGQTLLMASAMEAAAGRMHLAWVLCFVTLAATVGNSIGYGIGRWGGRLILDKLKVNAQRQHSLESLFERRGRVVILCARFLDGLRQLNGIVAGVLCMPWWIFTAYNVAGAILWTCAWGLGTYFMGRDIHGIAAFFHQHALLLYVLSVAAILGVLVYVLRSHKRA
jgi:membrane protein DedA with SNARE-associated domain